MSADEVPNTFPVEEVVDETERETPATAEALKELISNANLQYSLKNYEDATELYTQALQIQDELNGEMQPENADLHYLYGRCLFKVAVANSDVLGGQVAAEKTRLPAQSTKEESAASGSAALGIADADGDEEVDDNEIDGEPEGQEEEDDDFATAYEILEVARVLYERQLEGLENTMPDESEEGSKGKGKSNREMSAKVRQITERLADTHDLQSEISLENERFEDAATESKASLQLRQKLHPMESELIAEGHYKVAIAQEFAFFHAVREAKEAKEKQNGSAADLQSKLDPQLLFDAVKNLVLAIQSSEARIEKLKSQIAALSGDEQTKKKADLVDLEDIVKDMFTKLSDLSNSARSVAPNNDLSTIFDSSISNHITKSESILPAKDTLSALEGFNTADPITGEAVQKPGETAAERQARIDAKTATANDLSGLVRKKKPQPAVSASESVNESNGTSVSNGNGKRALDEGSSQASDGVKKVKFAE